MCSSEYNVDGHEMMNVWNNVNGDHGGHSAAEEAALGQQYFTATAEKFQNHNSGGFDDYQSHRPTGLTRIKLLDVEEEIGSSEAYSSLGLRLRKTPSLINLVEQELNGNYEPNTKGKKPISKPASEDSGSQPMSEKLKASNFPAKYLRIGKWERESRHEGDLVAKCYYAKKKLVWEILEGALKSKIEIQWNDIAGIRAITNDGEPGLLEIELNQAPTFHKETNPQPRKHTLWQQADDFTGSEALKHRIHHVRFAPEILGRHYKRLLDFCQRLASLSQSPFPSRPNPYFESFTRNAYQYPHEFLLEGYGGRPSSLPPLPNYQFPYFPHPQISGENMTMRNGHWIDNGNVNNMDFPSNVPTTHGVDFYVPDSNHYHNLSNNLVTFDENVVSLQQNLSIIHQQMANIQDGENDQANFQFNVSSEDEFPRSQSDYGTNYNLMVQPTTIYSSANTMYTYPYPYSLHAYDNNRPSL